LSRITRPRRTAGLLAAVALSAVGIPSAASAGTVKSGHLDWTQFNTYVGGTERTWLGYVTGPSPAQANGNATPIAPATGDTVTPASPRGAAEDFTTVFPATGGTYDATDGTGTIVLDGGLEFAAPAPPAGHGFTITVLKPKVVLNGLTGQIFASGQGGATPIGPYDRSKPLYDLDLSNATVTLKADGSRVLSGIVPSLATAGVAFPGNYLVGAGPERTPNTFGTFSLTVKTNGGDTGPAGKDGKDGAPGATGPAGPAGPAGKNGTSATIRSVKAVLAKAPFKGAATRKVGVYNSKGKKVASGTVKGRVLKVTLADKVTSLSGKVKLKVTGSTSSATVRIPS
jgi:hypothetical protein